MANHNHTGSIWQNATDKPHRRHGPGTNFAIIDKLEPGTSLIVLCYTRGETVTFTTPPLPNFPHGVTNTSDAWDFVITGDQDRGGYVADVFVNTGDDITKQLGAQGTCDALRQHLAHP